MSEGTTQPGTLPPGLGAAVSLVSAAALAYEACLAGYTALHATAIDIVNTLAAAQSTNRLKSELKKYLSPQILLVDELGYLPLPTEAASALFQVVSQRYLKSSIVLTTNRPVGSWGEILGDTTVLRLFELGGRR